MPLLDPVKDMKIGDKDFKQVVLALDILALDILALDIAPMHWKSPRVCTEAEFAITGQLRRLSADPS